MSLILFSLCLLLVIGWYECRKRRYRHLILDLQKSLERDQDFLVEANRGLATALGLDELLRVIRLKMEDRARMLSTNASQMEQIKTTFRNMREGVVVLSATNQILVANDSATNLLNEGRELTGRRIERFIHHPTFLDFVREVKQQGNRERCQIEVDLLGKEAWLEISGASLDTVATDGGGRPSLFLFNDITRLKRLEAIRREFVANVSHELRTPITILKGFAQTLFEDGEKLPPEKRAAFTEKIHRNVDRLNHLVEDLLALSHLESQDKAIEKAPASLNQEITLFHSEYKPPAESSADLLLEIPEEDIFAEVNSGIFQRVLTNLVDNAFKHAETNTFVRISLKADKANGLVEVIVSDDGGGIPERAKERVFQRFYRLDKGRSTKTGGTGLGLSIVRHSMLSMGGNIRVEDRFPCGTEFVCVFPLLDEGHNKVDE